jgi:hypothetical protein
MVDLVLILVVAVLAIGLGGYVRYQQIQTKKAQDGAANGVVVSKHHKSVTVKEGPGFDPTANWTNFSSVKGKFSLKYPPSWSKVVCDSNDATVYFGGNAKSVAICNSGFTGQMAVYAQTGDKRASYKLTGEDYSGISSSTAIVSGVAGTKESGTSVGNGVNAGAGDKLTRYVFFTNGITIVADYSEKLGNKDFQNVSADFDTVVQKTLKF